MVLEICQKQTISVCNFCKDVGIANLKKKIDLGLFVVQS